LSRLIHHLKNKVEEQIPIISFHSEHFLSNPNKSYQHLNGQRDFNRPLSRSNIWVIEYPHDVHRTLRSCHVESVDKHTAAVLISPIEIRLRERERERERREREKERERRERELNTAKMKERITKRERETERIGKGDKR
jgi:hypothetical protein